MKTASEIKEQKTGKVKRFPILGNLQSMLEEYTKNKDLSEYLFFFLT